jgi:hypothetical protein
VIYLIQPGNCERNLALMSGGKYIYTCLVGECDSFGRGCGGAIDQRKCMSEIHHCPKCLSLCPLRVLDVKFSHGLLYFVLRVTSKLCDTICPSVHPSVPTLGHAYMREGVSKSF